MMKIGKLYRSKRNVAHLKGVLYRGQVIMPILWDKSTTYDDMGQRTLWIVTFMIPETEKMTRIKFIAKDTWKNCFALVDISRS